jgi:aminopeptidase N
MHIWISKVGYPVLTVTEKPDQISVEQTRSPLTGDVHPEDDTTTWWLLLGP